ncbi:hypothetical protein INR49_018451, partial [Caranx melampygus]
MVEHNTNRAVIIDLGLAKFFRHGLNSAMDMGTRPTQPLRCCRDGGADPTLRPQWGVSSVTYEEQEVQALSPMPLFKENTSGSLTPYMPEPESITSGADIAQDFMKMRLYQRQAKDLPCNLPTTGRVVVRRFEERNGEVEKWEQKEVVTRGGKIIKFDDI